MNPPVRRARPDSGFTLIELLIAMVLGLVVVFSSLELLDRQQQHARTDALRTELQQNARYALDMIVRDLQQAGQGMDPNHRFGVVSMVNGQGGAPDTLFVLFLEPDTRIHAINDPGEGTEKTVLRLAITCDDPVDKLAPGQFVYFAHGSARGVARVTSVDREESATCGGSGTEGELVAGVDPVDQERHGWILEGNAAGGAAARARAAVYFVEESEEGGRRLIRANRIEDGAWTGAPIAHGVVDFQTEYVFRNGTVDVDVGGSLGYDDIDTIRVRLEAETLRRDKDLAGGDGYRRTFVVSVSPRNQLYTRNLR